MKLNTHFHRMRVATVSTLLTLVATLPTTQAQESVITHAAGMPVMALSLPDSVLRGQITALPATAQIVALDKLRNINFSSVDLPYLRTDRSGGIYIEDHFDIPAYLTNEPQAIDPLYQNITSTEVFALHSKPGASKVIYLDFNGHTITNTAWNDSTPSYTALPYDLDGSVNSFSSNELASIAQIWRRTAEDFSPFDVDITTEEPATFNSNTGRALITKNVTATGTAMPSNGGGGVAYLDVWGLPNYHTYYSPALIYYNKLAGGRADIVTEAVSHELGHNLGLSHDGSSTVDYYGGHGTGNTSWGPIMGTGYNRNVSQWSKGEYADANNPEDDVNIIADYLNSRIDDHSDTSESATPIVTDGTAAGNVISTTPLTDSSNFTSNNKGIIDTQVDRDTFQFDTSGGTVTLNVHAFRETSNTRGGNLDLLIILRDELGALIAENNLPDDTHATITAPLAAGRYYLTVDGGNDFASPYSDYGSLGQYFLSGNIPQSGSNDTTPDAFSFTDQTNVALSRVIISAPISVSGINTAAAISVSGGEYSINGAAYTATAGIVNDAVTVTVRHTSSANHATNTNTILTIGGITDTFTSTTLAATPDTTPDAFTLTDQTNVALSSAIVSTPISISGINTAAAISVSGGEYSINGAAYTATAGTVNDAATVTVRHTSSANHATNTNTILTIGGVADTFTSTTLSPPIPTLNIIKTGSGLGSVTSKPAGINCGADCSETYATSSTVVKLTATAGTNSVFNGWSGACNGMSTTCTVTVADVQNVTATFNYITYPLTVTKVGNGTVSSSPAGIDCGTDCTEAYNKGSTVTLTATPDANNVFAGWKGCNSKTNVCTISMTAAKTVTANFKASFALTVSKIGTGTGTIKATGINCDTGNTPDCTENYLQDTSVKLTATAATGSRFTSWSGACSGTTCTVKMTDAKNVIANFDRITYKLTVFKVGNGTITGTIPGIAGNAGIHCGTTCEMNFPLNNPALTTTLTATPDVGYVFTGWTGACKGTATCTVAMTKAQTVTSTFKQAFTLSVTLSGSGSGVVTSKPAGINCGTDCNENHVSNTKVTLSATAAKNSSFAGWTGDCVGTKTCSVTMAEAKNVTAMFNLK